MHSKMRLSRVVQANRAGQAKKGNRNESTTIELLVSVIWKRELCARFVARFDGAFYGFSDLYISTGGTIANAAVNVEFLRYSGKKLFLQKRVYDAKGDRRKRYTRHETPEHTSVRPMSRTTGGSFRSKPTPPPAPIPCIPPKPGMPPKPPKLGMPKNPPGMPPPVPPPRPSPHALLLLLKSPGPARAETEGANTRKIVIVIGTN